MGHFGYFFSYGLIFQIAAVVHFVRRRPDTFWLWIILFLGPLGSIVYLVVEAAPDLALLGGSFKPLQNSKRMRQLEWLVRENPAPDNYEELGQFYIHERRWTEARQCFDRAIGTGASSMDAFYRRGLCAFALSDYRAAATDFEQVVLKESNYDFYRAATSLAQCYAKLGNPEKADALFEQVTRCSTLTEAQLEYATFLSEQGRDAEALEWTERILAKSATMPRFQRRTERPLFRQAMSLRKRLRSARNTKPIPAGSGGAV
jgi:pentatricopeptide repeat protein